jgi:hypothetical protein
MAKEALDIERLNTSIFATPQKNVIQAMGRIMRKNSKDTGIRPLIIDFIDEIRSFSRHYERRKKIYDKCLYKIYNYYLQKNKIISKSENAKIKFAHDVKFEDEYERDWNFIFKEDEDNEDDENKDTNKIEIVNTYKYNKDDFKEYLFDT